MTRPRQTITVVPVEQLTAHPGNIRDDLGDLADMARSIREHGILQPLTATEHPTRDGVLLLLAGHRRLAAALEAGQDRVPVIIRHGVTDLGDQIVTMLVENTHRRDLSPVERAEAYGALRNRGMTNTEIGRATGTHVSVITYYLTLLDLDDASLKDVREGKVKSTAVQRFLGGEHSIAVTNAERVAIVRAWIAEGRSGGDLTRLTGWKVERYALAEREAS